MPTTGGAHAWLHPLHLLTVPLSYLPITCRRHASLLGIGFLLACLVAAGAYQAAPLRTVEVSSTHLMSDKDNGDTEEGEAPSSPPAVK